jgi:hypothetical protein
MRLAYLIQAHKNFEQLNLLLDKLQDENNDFFIHIDKTSDKLFAKLNNKFNDFKNIYIIKNRINVNWSGFSQVKATLKMMKKVKNNKKEYDYINFISGQDYPIKTNKEIKEFLTKNKGKQFLEYSPIGNYYWRLKSYNFFREHPSNRKIYFKILDNLIRLLQKFLIKRNNLKNYKLYKGSQWFTITYDCVKYIINFINKNPQYLEDFKYTACPDEHFFQIIIMNSYFKENVINNNFRYIKWSNNKNSPCILTDEDYTDLKESKSLFARKFDININHKILEILP